MKEISSFLHDFCHLLFSPVTMKYESSMRALVYGKQPRIQTQFSAGVYSRARLRNCPLQADSNPTLRSPTSKIFNVSVTGCSNSNMCHYQQFRIIGVNNEWERCALFANRSKSWNNRANSCSKIPKNAIFLFFFKFS